MVNALCLAFYYSVLWIDGCRQRWWLPQRRGWWRDGGTMDRNCLYIRNTCIDICTAENKNGTTYFVLPREFMTPEIMYHFYSRPYICVWIKFSTPYTSAYYIYIYIINDYINGTYTCALIGNEDEELKLHTTHIILEAIN